MRATWSAEPLRILHIVHQYLPEHVGGTEIYTQSLAAALQARGHEPLIFARGSGATRELRDLAWEGVRVLRAEVPESGPQAVLRATLSHPFLEETFRRALEIAQPDLVHVHHLMGLPASVPAIARRAGLPVVATLHDYWLLCPNAQLFTNYDQSVCSGPRLWLNCARCAAARLDRPLLQVGAPLIAAVMGWRAHLLRQAIGSIDRFIAPTAFVRDLYARMGLIDAGRATHIPHGIDTTGVLPHSPAGADGPLRVAYLGGISWQKGVHVLVDAVTGLEPSIATLKVYGDRTVIPHYGRHLTGLAAGHPNIEFAGRLSRSEVWQALSQTDVLVVPSLWYETAALVIQEALAAGVPVIGSRLGALTERIRDHVDGLLVPPGDPNALRAALLSLANDRPSLERLRAQIRPVVTIEEHIDQVLSLYHHLVRASRQR
jgi:glycosyltransferase involved in cell wall biosynthesis